MNTLDLIHSTDHELIAFAQAGSERACRELLNRYQRPVFSLIYRMVRDRELAEDLAQETFVKVFNHLDRYNPKFKFSSWVFKIGSNLAIDTLRKRQLRTISLDGSRKATSEDEIAASRITVASGDENPEEQLLARELGEELERAIGMLRPEYQTAILLRHVEGRPYEEIAGIMGMPLGTIKTHLHRARNELKQLLAHLRVGM
ncbi:MAG: sigma-70 family RNA polymerase sigma factor [Gemmatimonadota bacterium]|nr:sigma-70 family RNA polymerase sigma factor [Gemmatimonadota bacterium]